MFHKTLILLLGLLCLLPVAAHAQTQEPPPSNAWRATYWNNPSLAGFSRVQQTESEDLDRDWANAAPVDGINPDYWSARWERTIQLRAATYRFTALADNGVRVWVNDTLVVNGWQSQWNQTANLFFGDIVLEAGSHVVRVEYYDSTGPASLQVTWEPYVGPPTTVNGWLAEYFNNATLSGTPAFYRDEAEIALNLQARSPQPGVIGVDNFSVRWTRRLALPPGIYAFTMRVDDGGRLQIDGELVLDGWRDQGPTNFVARIDHAGGPIDVVMEYYERTGFALAELTWERVGDLPSVEPASPSPAPSPAPTLTAEEEQTPSDQAIILDDGDEGFSRGGADNLWRPATSGYADDFLVAANLRSGQGDYVWARWQPDPDPGRYEIFVFVPRAERATQEARYWVAANGRYTLRIVDQQRNVGRWVPLGVFTFGGVSNEYITLSNITGEDTESTRVLWDALRLEPR